MADIVALLIITGFLIAVLGTVEIDRWLERRRIDRMRNQARPMPRMHARHAAARWHRS